MNISTSELYYVTRNVFRRNKIFYQRGGTCDVRRGQGGSNLSFSRNLIQDDDEKAQQANQSFERFFQTSARKSEIKQVQEFNRSKQRFLYTRERTLSLANIDPEQYPYRHVFPRSPEFNFGKSQERIDIFTQNKLDDERRYNNFFLTKTDFSKTIGMHKVTPRPNFVFQVNMQDKIYDRSYQAYQKIMYNATNTKCLFDHNKQSAAKSYRNLGNRLNEEPIRIQFDRDSIEKAEKRVSPYKQMNIPAFQHQIGRDRPGSSPYNILKNNENYYVHLPRTRQRSKKLVVKEIPAQ